ncbi:hypothetical protein [Metabacillus litoralis]|uniref:hypothetical protein n=1 Tax=Metabacillus litoralis TaxID=152268 RepID=UPI001CFC6AD0|nr:hypothetical protein [Metabacillus litoralis]
MDLEEILANSKGVEKESEEKLVEEKQKTKSTPKPADRFSQLMFGSRSENHHPKVEEIQPAQESEKQEVNYFTLMEQIDDIMISVENLKPMLKQFSPLLDYIKKKS